MQPFDPNQAANTPVDNSGLLRFLIPSIIGVVFFLIPLPYDGEFTLLLSLIVNHTKAVLADSLVPLVIGLLAISAVASVVGRLAPSFYSGFLKQLFVVSWWMTAVRVVALVLSVMIYWQIGPEMIWSKNTGGLMLKELMTALVPFFFWAGLALPLLTDYGFMELIGTLFRKVMRPLFKVPGRAAVDCTASWIGSGTVGVVITDQQYRNGFYTAREAITIATGFSVVSIPIVALFVSFLGITELLPEILLSMVVTGIILAVIMPRIPPISLKADTYWEHAEHQGIAETMPAGVSSGKAAIRVAAARGKHPREDSFLASGAKVVADIWFALEPIVMVLGVLVTVIAEFTPFFQWISLPFVYILGWFGLADGATAAPTLMIGFADVFLPFILGGDIGAIQTKFVVGVVALVQIIYMTEPGALLLKSPIPVNVFDLFVIFLLRTLIALPIAVLLSYILL
ncbi:YjiH family protein [Roseovarius pelagicus]|uniref:YjiH family protein n=1 Tax=Roseovarius pelagicus TaxID=2980108 RepID=A0ABY6DF70_9RHOB|nr:YjiH family protein [Roseovarius pelagicus]UXX84786.1 YjiH family protein [Roseovarius pelagicus]